MPLIIPKRDIYLASNVPFKPKTVGEDHYTRLALGVIGLTATPDEFGQLMLDEKAWGRYYKKYKDREPEPRDEVVRSLDLAPFDQANVTLYAARRVIKLVSASCVKNTLALQQGGNTLWNFTVQALLQDLDAIPALLQKMGDKAAIEIECESYGAQPDLPLESDEEGEDESEDDEEGAPGASRMQRNIEANEERRAKKGVQ